MFVAVARVALSIPEAGSLKSKRHVVHKVLDKVKARFNVSAAEVGDLDLWQRATLGFAAVANEHAFAQESISKVVKFVEELYVAPIIDWTSEVIPLGGELFGDDATSQGSLGARHAVRTLADVEREAGDAPTHADDFPEPSPRSRGKPPKKAMTEEQRVRAIDDLRRRLKESRRSVDDPDNDNDDEA